jgi:hypothetical protein
VGSLASRIDANQEEMKAMLDGSLRKTEAYPEEMETASEHPEVPKEEAAVETFGAPKKRHRDCAVTHSGKPKERT